MGNSSQGDNLDAYIHPRLGAIKRLQQQQSAQYIEYCVGVESERLLKQWQTDLKQLKDIGAAEFLFLPLSFNFDKTAMCGTGGNIDIKFEDYMFALAPEIKNRKDIKRPFREEEVWYLLYNLAQAGALLEKREIKIGDVRPENILLNEDGEFKIISSYSWPNNPDSNQLIMEDPDSRVFLSPEECQFHNKKKGLAYPDGLDFNACEVFSMGLTVLQTGTLKDCYDGLYERSNKQWRFNEYKVRDFTNILQERYSRQLTLIIMEMLRISPEKRIKCSTIVEALAPYKQQIINIQEFTIDKTALYDTIQSASRDKSTKNTGKSSLSGIINNHMNDLQYKNQNYDYNEPRVSSKPNFGQPQSSPRNLTASMKSTGNQMTSQQYSSVSSGSQNGGMNGMVFSFQAPPKGYNQQSGDGMNQTPHHYNHGYQHQHANRSQQSPIHAMHNYPPQNYGQLQYQQHHFNDFNMGNRAMYHTQIPQHSVETSSPVYHSQMGYPPNGHFGYANK